VIGRKEVGGKVKYLIHWQGYSTGHDTWEPEENLKNCKYLIDEFNVSLPIYWTSCPLFLVWAEHKSDPLIL